MSPLTEGDHSLAHTLLDLDSWHGFLTFPGWFCRNHDSVELTSLGFAEQKRRQSGCLPKAVRILVVTPFMWSGAGKTIVRLAGALQDLGHDLCVVSSGESKGLKDWPGYVDQLKAARIPYHQVD